MDSQKNGKTIDVYILSTKSAEQDQEKLKSPKSFWHVDKEMLRFKIHYFLYVGGLAAAMPFVVVLAKDRLGISASSLGAVLTAQMFIFIFTKILIGYLADYFNKLKEMIVALIIIYISCFFLLLTIPVIEIEMFPTSNEVSLKNNCTKYHDILYATNLKDTSNTTSLETSNVSHFLSSNEFHKSACYPLSESDFENVIMGITNEYPYKQTYKESSQNSSNNFVIIILSETFQEKFCFISLNSQKSFSIENISCNIFRDRCIYESSATAKFNPETFNDVRLQCSTCNNENYTLLSSQDKIYIKKDTETYQFWLFALLYTVAGVAANAIFTLSDTACNESIQKHGGSFGQQRLWGGIGWGSVAPLAGFINDCTGGFLASYFLQGVMLVLFLWNMSKIDLVKPTFSKNILRDVGTVLQSKDFLMFEAMVFLNGLGTGMIWYYLIWFLHSIGGSDLLCGLTLTVQSFVGVIPFMFFSGYIIKKLGHFNILIVGLAGYTIRFLWYSYLQNPWFVLPVEFMHGITYGLYYTALASYAKLSAKPGTEATTQAIIFGTHEGLGSGIGCVISGIGFDYFGGHQTFFYSSMACLSGASIGLFLSLHLQKRKGTIQVAAP
ncbi:hypothetical protein JTE90_000943 [Oedothorax gibbosus]|uniref:Major facilitator superfamily associated domain-containing protein n=1 Tax=Oedothorax gibbosus TaxID=931172 RepID=A0AAV6U5G6_9ARAC|nr:hypothetical protein JTE90_000943 [Oedothorax gibbosus]